MRLSSRRPWPPWPRLREEEQAIKAREDDFDRRRAGLASLDDEALHDLFWNLTRQVTRPLLELARTHTTPSIERSVLARMGVAGSEARLVVEGCLARGLLGHGAGHVLLRASRAANCSPVEAAARLASGELWDSVEGAFDRETSSS